ncbi:hypothetical protein [Mesorhizobium kowhaii]|nr:hypothetical protein [Mesorhizobium kowhaii]
MAKIKLAKTAVDAATPRDHDYELQDTTVPGFMLNGLLPVSWTPR